MRIAEALEIVPHENARVIRCTRCQHIICDASEEWKKRAAMCDKPVTNAGPLFPRDSPFLLREFYCPGCGTMLDVDVVMKGDPIISDRVQFQPIE
ncbi:MAG: hypothetical protein HY673_26025 [Chloroflexi bacterium]|nr:hypothetical protein [Chloroflexota bacterium]